METATSFVIDISTSDSGITAVIAPTLALQNAIYFIKYIHYTENFIIGKDATIIYCNLLILQIGKMRVQIKVTYSLPITLFTVLFEMQHHATGVHCKDYREIRMTGWPA